MGKEIILFATREDIRPILKDFEDSVPVKYILAGLFDTDTCGEILSLAEHEQLGQASGTSSNQCSRYLVLPADASLLIRPVPQNRGGIKYAVDQLVNPDSLIISPAGILKEGIMIAGSISTASSEKEAMKLFRPLEKRIKVAFKKIGRAYVGKMAEMNLQTGWRMTQSERSPIEYDLKT